MEKTVKKTVINIKWECIDFDRNFNSIKELKEDFDFGLYQIYGDHPAYGKNSLLYIGKAQKQTFAIRLKDRFEFIESYFRPTKIRIGRIVRDDRGLNLLEWNIKRWGDMIDIAEKILIKSHSPALNKQEISGLFLNEFISKNGNFTIINWEDFGSLLPEVSTYRLSYNYWNFNTPLTEKEYNDSF